MRVNNWNPQKFDGEIIAASMDRLERAAELIADDARGRCPVISGLLKKSIRVVRLKSSDARNVRIYAGNREKKGAFYAGFVEYGHGPKKKKHPFLRPAIDNNRDRIQGILRNGK